MRPAESTDLPGIYQFLNVPLRERLMVEPLPAESEFLQQAEIEMKSGREVYHLLVQDSAAVGLIRIMLPRESCEIWGRSLSTLYYQCGRIAFEDLGVKRLQWCVRQNNRRMVRICDIFGAEKMGESTFFNFGNKLSFVAAGVINFYEFTPDSYRNHLAIMRRYVLPISNIPENDR